MTDIPTVIFRGETYYTVTIGGIYPLVSLGSEVHRGIKELNGKIISAVQDSEFTCEQTYGFRNPDDAALFKLRFA